MNLKLEAVRGGIVALTLVFITGLTTKAQSVHVASSPLDTRTRETALIDDGSYDQSISTSLWTTFMWMNRFTLPADHFPLAIHSIEVMLYWCTIGDRFDTYVYLDTDSNPGNGATLIGSVQGETMALRSTQNFNSFRLDPPVIVESPGDLIVAAVNRDCDSGAAASEYPGMLDTTSPQLRSWIGLWDGSPIPQEPNLPAPTMTTTTDYFSGAGFDGNWMIRLVYAPYVVHAPVTAILEGAYLSGGQMATGLVGRIPLSQPFWKLPWDYPGTEIISPMPVDAVDWVLLELRTDSTVASTFSRRAMLLLSDGSVVDTSGAFAPEYAGAMPDSVYVVLRHRNHVDVMTKKRIGVAKDSLEYSFSAAPDRAYGWGATVSLGDGYFGLPAGDANADGRVQALDYNDYIYRSSLGFGGYRASDFNLDGAVEPPDSDLYILNATRAISSQIPE